MVIPVGFCCNVASCPTRLKDGEALGPPSWVNLSSNGETGQVKGETHLWQIREL